VNTDFDSYLTGEKKMSGDVLDQMWSAYASTKGVSSPNVIYNDLVRKNTFASSVESIIAHNSQPGVSFKKGINAYSDMTEEEFVRHFNLDVMEEQNCSATDKRQSVNKKIDLEDIPSSWDWRTVGGVSPVKNQGHCGSCWTFSTVGCLEAASLIKYGTFDSLAEQQLVDCAGAFDNNGCNGGLPSHAFEYISSAGGISTEDAYPYYAEDRTCTVDASTFALNVEGGSVNITEGDETEMLHAVFEIGPVSIAFQVVDGFRDYTSGVYTSDVCKNGTNDVNHAVLAVGFGVEDGVDYWLVKNSWGADWGDQGYFKIQRNVNMCGVAECNAYPAAVTKLSKETQFLQ
jgi:cathepsin H